MQELKPIPTSASVIWRNVRLRILPVVVFAAVAVTLASMWTNLDGGGIPGVAEGLRSIVSAPQIGIIETNHVKPYEWVDAGQPLVTFVPVDPRAKLDLLQSELQIARLRLEPSLADQNALDYERLRVENLRLRQEIATAKVNLQRAENTLRRNTELRKEKLVSEEAYDLSIRDRDMYQSEIVEKGKSIKEIEERMASLRGLGEPQAPGTNEVMRAILAGLETKVDEARTNWCAITLKAPISGMVQNVFRHAGEYVTEAEPLVTINSKESDRIVAYLRQPYTHEFEAGDDVEIITRTKTKRHFRATISTVGAQVEVITNSLAFMRLGALVDVGLPVAVNVPAGVNIRPGETVDIIPFPRPRAGKSQAIGSQNSSQGPSLSRAE